MKRAIALLAWNRPTYLGQCISALNKANPGYPVYAFIDGLFNAQNLVVHDRHAKERIESRDLVNSVQFLKDVFQSPVNLDGPLSTIGLLSTLFDMHGYDEVTILEDDVVVAEKFFDNVNAMSDAFGEVHTAGSWCCFGASNSTDFEKEKRAVTTISQPLGITFKAMAWKACRGMILRYANMVSKCERRNVIVPISHLFSEWGCPNAKGMATHTAMIAAMVKNGMASMATKVNCLKNIGAVGLNTREEDYKARGYEDMPVFDGVVDLSGINPKLEAWKGLKHIQEVYSC